MPSSNVNLRNSDLSQADLRGEFGRSRFAGAIFVSSKLAKLINLFKRPVRIAGDLVKGVDFIKVKT